MGRIVLCGKAASGKDHMRKVLESRGFRYGVSYTTRPPRAGEVDGKDYYFISVDEFEALLEDGYWYEWVELMAGTMALVEISSTRTVTCSS